MPVRGGEGGGKGGLQAQQSLSPINSPGDRRVQSGRWKLVGCCRRERFQFFRNDFFHVADSAEIGEFVVFGLLIKDEFIIQAHFQSAIRAWGDGDRGIRAISPKELVRHPRGGRVMLSRYAIDDIQMNFPLRGHNTSPLCVGFVHRLDV